MDRKKVQESGMMYGKHWPGRELAHDDLLNFRRNGSTDGLDGNRYVEEGVGTITKGSEFLYNCVLSLCGQQFIDKYYRCGVGNPDTVACMGKQLTISDVMAIYNAWQLSRFLDEPKHIVEIGPGYGALSSILKSMYPDARITLVDLPEHHSFQRYYMEETVGLDGVTVTTELPPDADVVIALRCMMEMTYKEVSRYLSWLQSIASVKIFYLISRYLKTTILKEYPFDDDWAALISQTTFIQANMHEFLLMRLFEESGMFRAQLKSLPPYECENVYVDYKPRELAFGDLQEWRLTHMQTSRQLSEVG